MELIKKYEGCRLQAYKPHEKDKWTIGWGNTYYKSEQAVQEGDIISQKEADELLEWYVNTQIRLPSGLNSNQIKALQSLIYNIGQTAFDSSQLKTAIVNNDKKAIFKNWDWISSGGVILDGLIKRRAEEIQLFFTR